MSRVSYIMFANSGENINLTGDKVRASAYYGQVAAVNTISIYVSNLRGRVYLEASLATNPTELDWFPVKLDGANDYLQFPLNPAVPTGQLGDTGVVGYTFKGNYIWLRARLDRSYLLTGTETPDIVAQYGTVDKILINN